MKANEPLPRLAAQQAKGSVTGWTELARLGDAPEFNAELIRLAKLAPEPHATRLWLLGRC